MTKVCYHCGISKKIGQFAKNQFSEDGYDGICKKCRKETIQNEEDLVKYSELNTRPFHKDLLERSMDKHSESLKIKYKSDNDKYYKEVFKKAMTDYYRSMNFYDRSCGFSNINSNNADSNNNVISSDWGNSYTKEECVKLDKFYNDMINTHDISTPQHKELLKLMCKLNLEMDKCLADKDFTNFSKIHAEYQKILTSSGFRPIDKTASDSLHGIRTFSQIWAEVEKDGFIKPAPIEENQDIVDKTIMYMLNYQLKLLNMQQLSSPPLDTPKVGEDDGIV